MRIRGFTLIELLLYIGLTAVILFTSLALAWRVIDGQTKQSALSEVEYAGGFALHTITYNAERATALTGSIYAINPGKLILTYTSAPQIVIDTYDKQIVQNSATITIKKIRMQIGANPAVDLTSDRVTVTHFTVSQRSTSAAVSAQIDLSIQMLNPSNSQSFNASNSWRTTFTCQKPL